MTTGQPNNIVSNVSLHESDPETGKPKSGRISVKEYYVNGKDGRRLTKRVEEGKTTYYYSSSHIESTYKYALII
jgi:hypothetical protein